MKKAIVILTILLISLAGCTANTAEDGIMQVDESSLDQLDSDKFEDTAELENVVNQLKESINDLDTQIPDIKESEFE